LALALQVAAGMTAVMGPSGAGKTTLLSAIAGLLTPVAGQITLDDRVLFDRSAGVDLPTHRRRVAVVFQSYALFPHLSVIANAAYGAPQPTRAGRLQAGRLWLDRFRVAHLAERMPATLSGGEAQRVALARALASEPRALLLDEPFSALDAALRRQLGTELREWVGELAIPALLVTHDLGDAEALGQRLLRLEGGRLVGEPGDENEGVTLLEV
jgi:molybdate transport system ATP-binding protein